MNLNYDVIIFGAFFQWEGVEVVFEVDAPRRVKKSNREGDREIEFNFVSELYSR